MQNNTKNKKTVFVGVSGGVDSSVALALLKKKGYDVVGVFIRTWSPDFIECTWQKERLDAMRVCAHLDVPFLECDAEESYKRGVADYMIEEYRNGRTPNPDVMCNREVKFGVFWEFAKKYKVDYIATGHYAKVESKDLYMLAKGIDETKDQSYFLWTLTQNDLTHVLFPVGNLTKRKVRRLAKKYRIPVADKKDSQGVCFLGPLDMKDFLKHYIESKIGNVLSEQGEIVGHHFGALFFTLGERHGFTITKKSKNDSPYYVISKNIKDNTITVSNQKISENISREILITNINWILGKPEEDKSYTCQIRYHGELLNCSIKSAKDNEMLVVFEKDILVDNGQSIVIYNKDICLGGGVVK